ncbi:MAG: hypothetical protein L0K86_19285 [Actinomycetia bacterium]|nr:hypothetical protein [Actinomycetes bacterium]
MGRYPAAVAPFGVGFVGCTGTESLGMAELHRAWRVRRAQCSSTMLDVNGVTTGAGVTPKPRPKQPGNEGSGEIHVRTDPEHDPRIRSEDHIRYSRA